MIRNAKITLRNTNEGQQHKFQMNQTLSQGSANQTKEKSVLNMRMRAWMFVIPATEKNHTGDNASRSSVISGGLEEVKSL